MKIVIALDSFKGGLSAEDACRVVEQGIRDTAPSTSCIRKPMADGGEGTAAALLAARPGGEWVSLPVPGPLPGKTVQAGYARFPGDGLAVVEMAAASGLPLLTEKERNPLVTTTLGTGYLLKAAADRGAKHILLTLGGSATVDGGVGAAEALGWQFRHASGRTIAPGGGALRDLARIVHPAHLFLPPVTALCDVTNPLCGPDGAAAVFGPQKGATPEMVPVLEAGLANLARRIKEDLGREVASIPGAGAAGGFGAGALAFLNARLAPGIDTVIEASGLRDALKGADICLTGEGSFDAQSLHGKVVSGVANAARELGVPVVVFAGRVKAEPGEYRPCGIREAVATHAPEMPMAEVMAREPELLRTTAAQWMKTQGNPNT